MEGVLKSWAVPKPYFLVFPIFYKV